jgi:prepilin-type N-terminal cleavage/methylation domain-containing protein
MRRKANAAAGFTLVEMLAVLVLLGILAVVVLPRYGALQDEAALRAVDAGVAELNTREKMAWSRQRIGNSVPGSDSAMDAAVRTEVDTTLGARYTWASAPGADGGTLEFEGQSVALARSAATLAEPAVWSR